MDYRQATITIDVPIVKKEKGKIVMTYHVAGMIQIIEDQIAAYMSTQRKITKPADGKTRYEEAKFMLGELKKFYLAEAAEVKTLPEEV